MKRILAAVVLFGFVSLGGWLMAGAPVVDSCVGICCSSAADCPQPSCCPVK